MSHLFCNIAPIILHILDDPLHASDVIPVYLLPVTHFFDNWNVKNSIYDSPSSLLSYKVNNSVAVIAPM